MTKDEITKASVLIKEIEDLELISMRASQGLSATLESYPPSARGGCTRVTFRGPDLTKLCQDVLVSKQLKLAELGVKIS